MTLVINSVDYAPSEGPIAILDVREFIARFEYDIDKLYIDKFWDSISGSDKWITVDYETLRWMGYASSRDRDNRRKYMNILNNNFIEGKDFEDVSSNDIRVGAAEVAGKKVIIVHPSRFKESLMLLQTEQSKIIRQYYTTLETILIDYMRYTQYVHDYNSNIEKTKLIEENQKYKSIVDQNNLFDINTNPMKMTEYVYVLTSKRYYRQHMFKIGKSINLKQRLVSHNTTAATDEDTMIYTHAIPTFDCGALEKMMHCALSTAIFYFDN